ncbi:MAG TPA: hypothetical protein VEA99_14735 [Gemmatimonadaceae bacterium]|nr:hypothetical protein [Gemmatimonadaceae bacterium]
MVPPLAGLGPDAPAASRRARHAWLTEARQLRVRNVLVGIVLFVALAVWVFHSVMAHVARPPAFVQKLRVVGVMTWLYALVQLVDLRFYNSRFARRRVESTGLPESVLAWLFGQMVAWFGILYYALTEDVRWFVAGLVIAVLTMRIFPAGGRR